MKEKPKKMKVIFSSNHVLKYLFIFPFFFIFSKQIIAQNLVGYTCGTNHDVEKHPFQEETYQQHKSEFEQYYKRKVQSLKSEKSLNLPIYTIPTVVHIIHNNAPLGSTANPTNATIEALLNATTERFRHTHAGAGSYSNPYYGADSEIEFCLVGTDPYGSYTSGVVRHNDASNSVGTISYINANIEPYIWDRQKYCNMVIVTDLTDASGYGGNGITLYDATELAASYGGERLTAHELGHYFFLRHTFQGGCNNGDCTDDGDAVCDTPPKLQPGFVGGSCSNPDNSCTTDEDDTSTNNPYRAVSAGGLGDQEDMVVNYMDYTGVCQDAFTEGQKTRMRATIDVYKPDVLANSIACNAAPIYNNDTGITFWNYEQTDICTELVSFQVNLKNYGSNLLTSAQIQIFQDNNPVLIYDWTGSIPFEEEQIITLPTNFTAPIGSFQFFAKAILPNGVTDNFPANDGDLERTIQYLGGNGCVEYGAGCQTYNPNTASGPGNPTTHTFSATFQSANIYEDLIKLCVTTRGDNGSVNETVSYTHLTLPTNREV